MKQRLFVTEFVHTIPDRGIAISGRQDSHDLSYKIGDGISIHTESGEVFSTSISGIGLGTARSGYVDLLVPSDADSTQFEPGYEVWLTS